MQKIRNVLIVFFSVFLMITIAPLIGFYTSHEVILDKSQDPIVISDPNDNTIKEAFAYPFTLKENQKADIEFLMSLSNSTVTLKILEKEIYDKNYLLNSSPMEINGEDFLYVRGSDLYGGNSPSNYTTIYEEGSRYIRFSGGTDGSELVYRPGNYVILVYGSNEENSQESSLSFNLIITLDGPGNIIEILLITTALLILIFYGLFTTINYFRKIEIPYKKRTKKKKILIIQT